MAHIRRSNTNYIIVAVAAVLFVTSVLLTIEAGVGLGLALIWNVLASLYVYYDLIPANLVNTPPIFVASLLDAFVFALFAVFLATWFTELIRSINISEYFALSKIKRMKGHIVVVPYNSFSATLIEEMKKAGMKFVVLAEDQLQASRLYSKNVLAVVGGVRGKSSFTDAGIERASYVIACGDDDVKNALIAISAKDANPNVSVLSRVIEEENMPKLDKAGASWVIIPDVTAGASIGSEIVKRVV